MTEKLRFLAKGTACVPDPHGTESTPQRRRIVGRTHKEVSPGTWAWVRKEKPEELPFHHDLAKAVRDGDLWPADEASARACGVKFDPSFGGEFAQPKAEEKKEPAEPDEQPAEDAGGKGDV